jgi:hypothetical protein
MIPVPLSVKTFISLGRRTKENFWGRREWFSIKRETEEALLLNTLPKSIYGGVNVTEFTVKQHNILNLTGST